jgi:ribosomal protein S21
MKISVKRYNNDVSRAYRIMMRKLNAEGFYTEVKRKSFYVSKKEKEREDKKAGVKRYKKAEKKREELLQKLENKQFSNKKKRPYRKKD